MGGCKTKALLITYEPIKTNGRDKMNQLLLKAKKKPTRDKGGKTNNRCQAREYMQPL